MLWMQGPVTWSAVPDQAGQTFCASSPQRPKAPCGCPLAALSRASAEVQPSAMSQRPTGGKRWLWRYWFTVSTQRWPGSEKTGGNGKPLGGDCHQGTGNGDGDGDGDGGGAVGCGGGAHWPGG